MQNGIDSKTILLLARHIPHFALSIACIGDGATAALATAGSQGSAVKSYGTITEIPPKALFDCVVLGHTTKPILSCDSALQALLQHLSPHGVLLTALPTTFQSVLPPEFEAALLGHHLFMMRCEPLYGDLSWFTFARETYDPLVHASGLYNADLPGRAAAVLDWLEWCTPLSDEQRALIALRKLHYYRKAAEMVAPDTSHGLLFQAQKEFHIAVHAWPRRSGIYCEQAAIWRRFHNDDYAARLLRSIASVTFDAEINTALAACDPQKTVQPDRETSPEWTGAKRTPRLLILNHSFSDYGMDSLFDGLCQVLGSENVVEFPWKPTLHGQHKEATVNYPCWFDYPGSAPSQEQLRQELRDGRFDAIVFSDFVELDKPELMASFLDAAPGIPLIVYDPWDDGSASQYDAKRYLGGREIAAYFKREMLACLDYGPNAYPLPFGYPDRHVPQNPPAQRSTDLFWAGKRLFGTRSLYLDRLSELLGRSLDRKYPQHEYARALSEARIGLSLFGFGFDTVRYWELAANSCMLLAERPLIRIPFNFVEGESAIFFDDLPELEQKLTYYLAHPDEATAIGEAGRRHFLRYHTTSARARQFLGRIEHLLPA